MVKLLKAQDLATRMDWHLQTVYNRRHNGQSMPPAIKLAAGGGLRFREDDVEAWLESQVERASGGAADVE